MSGVTVNKGDFFAVPLAANSFGAGVVAGKWNEELYLVFFKERFSSLEDVRETNIGHLSPFLASSSLDAKLWHGHWPVVRRNVDTSWIAQPIYKVEESGGLLAESFDREFRKTIDESVAAHLRYRKVLAPVRLENALRSYHGIGDWNAAFDEVLFTNVEIANRACLCIR